MDHATATAPALPCATSNAADAWTASHNALKAGPGWDDPACTAPAGVQILGVEIWEARHCLGCGSTIYRVASAHVAAVELASRWLTTPAPSLLAACVFRLDAMTGPAREAVLFALARRHGALAVLPWTLAVMQEMTRPVGRA
jgi:hypothetical protein